MVTKSAMLHSPETKYKRSNIMFPVTSIALTSALLCTFHYTLVFFLHSENEKWNRKRLLLNHTNIHIKTLIEIAMVLSTNSGSFPSNLHISATFLCWIHYGKFWNLGISNFLWDIQCWRKGQIVINLRGKTDVRNCDLSPRDFCARYKTVLGVAKGFCFSV